MAEQTKTLFETPNGFSLFWLYNLPPGWCLFLGASLPQQVAFSQRWAPAGGLLYPDLGYSLTAASLSRGLARLLHVLLRRHSQTLTHGGGLGPPASAGVVLLSTPSSKMFVVQAAENGCRQHRVLKSLPRAQQKTKTYKSQVSDSYWGLARQRELDFRRCLLEPCLQNLWPSRERTQRD